MRKQFTTLFFAGLLAMGGLTSLSAGESALGEWLKNIRAKINNTQPQKRHTTTTAAAVRGSKDKGADKMYWAGREKPQAVTAEEVNAFSAAVELMEANKLAEAGTELDKFIAQFPKSPLMDDVKAAQGQIADVQASAPSTTAQ